MSGEATPCSSLAMDSNKELRVVVTDCVRDISGNSTFLKDSGRSTVEGFAQRIDLWFAVQKACSKFCLVGQNNLHNVGTALPSSYKEELHVENKISELKSIVDQMKSMCRKMAALSQLSGYNNVLFNTWTCLKLSSEMDKICDMYVKETELKCTILENLMHCNDENLMEVYVSACEYNTNIDKSKVQLFLSEVNKNNIF